MPQFTMVGATFRPAEVKEIIKALRPGAVVNLEADPYNEYDTTAVKVMRDGEHIGFVPKDENGPLFYHLRDNEVTGEVIAFESTLKPVIEYIL